MASTSDIIEKTRINVYLPKDLVDKVDQEAIRLGMSRSNILSLCADVYFRSLETQKIVAKGMEYTDELGMDFIKGFMQQR